MGLKIVHLTHNDKIKEKNLVLCLGFFDGMHIAHIKLIDTAKAIAREKGLPLAVFSFTESVQAFLKKQPHQYLTTIDDKADICAAHGVDYLYIMQVSNEMIHMEAQDFITRYLLATHTIVVGFDFRFGYMGVGDKDMLLKQKTFSTIVIPEMIYQGQKIGTTGIKQALKHGDLKTANYLLGRPYSIKGRVIAGKGVGKHLGFPTANIDYQSYFLPQSGVYMTRVIHDGNVYNGVSNIGNRPTFNAFGFAVETYIFDLDTDLYDKVIEIQFLEYMRPEVKYPSKEALIEQIRRDIDLAALKIKEAIHD